GGRLGAAGAATVNGGIFNLNGNNHTVGALSGSGGTIALGASALTVNETGNTSYAGTISGSGHLALNGSGTLTLSGSNTYTGGTTVNRGTLSISSNSSLGNGGTLTLGPGTTLAFTVGGSYTHRITVSGDPTFDVAAGQTA